MTARIRASQGLSRVAAVNAPGPAHRLRGVTSISQNSVATIHYQLTLDDGSIADSSFGGDPLVYLHGHGNIVPGLERQLAGKGPGDKFEAIVPSSEGYGELDPQAEQTVQRSAFPPDVDLKPGLAFQGQDDKGNVIPLFIRSVNGDDIVITANHPLAGQRLNFKIEVVEVRTATGEEIEHGHVHGPGGHDH